VQHVLPFLPLVRDLLVGVFALWWANKSTSPKAHEQAAQLVAIADAAAAAALAMNPGADWLTLLSATLKQIKGAAGLTVSDLDAINREAVRALNAAGIYAPNTTRPGVSSASLSGSGLTK